MFRPKKIIITQEVNSSPLIKTILRHCPDAEVVYQEVERDSPLLQDRKNLILIRNKGTFYKPCPATLNYLCCQYKILHIGLNCPLSCTYCILQAYLDFPAMVIHANIGEMIEEMDRVLAASQEPIIRMGTGEFTDSMALDHITELSKTLVSYFSSQSRAFLELKTKTVCIDNLKGLNHGGQIIVSWSLNSSKVVREDEAGAPSIESRLLAAQKCQDWGYKIGFHFDPIIFYPGWEKDYQETIDKLFSLIKADYITWISLGCFRYMPQLKGIIQEKFPLSRIVYEEFIRGMDGKMRYLETIRQEIYSKIVSWIRQRAPQTFIYFCMESPKIWRHSLGFAPNNNQELKSWLDQRCHIKI